MVGDERTLRSHPPHRPATADIQTRWALAIERPEALAVADERGSMKTLGDRGRQHKRRADTSAMFHSMAESMIGRFGAIAGNAQDAELPDIRRIEACWR